MKILINNIEHTILRVSKYGNDYAADTSPSGIIWSMDQPEDVVSAFKKFYETAPIRDIKTAHFVITEDHLESRKRTDIGALKKEGYVRHFKLYDDDDNLYYSGYTHLRAYGEDEEFDALDWAMADSGCTYMKVRNPETKKYEVL